MLLKPDKHLRVTQKQQNISHTFLNIPNMEGKEIPRPVKVRLGDGVWIAQTRNSLVNPHTELELNDELWALLPKDKIIREVELLDADGNTMAVGKGWNFKLPEEIYSEGRIGIVPSVGSSYQHSRQTMPENTEDDFVDNLGGSGGFPDGYDGSGGSGNYSGTGGQSETSDSNQKGENATEEGVTKLPLNLNQELYPLLPALTVRLYPRLPKTVLEMGLPYNWTVFLTSYTRLKAR